MEPPLKNPAVLSLPVVRQREERGLVQLSLGRDIQRSGSLQEDIPHSVELYGDQIIWSVVFTVAILVIHPFARVEFTTEHLHGIESRLSLPLAGRNLDKYVSIPTLYDRPNGVIVQWLIHF
jgi:hypothetical protein